MRWQRHSGGNTCCTRVSLLSSTRILVAMSPLQTVHHTPQTIIIRFKLSLSVELFFDRALKCRGVPFKESLNLGASHIGLYREILASPQGTASSGVHLYRPRVSIELRSFSISSTFPGAYSSRLLVSNSNSDENCSLTSLR